VTHARAWRCALCGWLNPSDAKACASCEKGKPRKRKRLDPSFRPWACVVLALDAGSCSGWAIWVLGKLAASGEHSIYSDAGLREVVRVVEQAKAYAAHLGVPWVALIEQAWGGRMGVGLGCAAGYWMFALRNAQLPRARIGSVLPNVWRACVAERLERVVARQGARRRGRDRTRARARSQGRRRRSARDPDRQMGRASGGDWGHAPKKC